MPRKPAAKTARKLTLEQALPYMLIVGGIIGIICSFIISYDKLQLLQNPNFTPICDLNPVVSCGSVMKSWQGSVFGFPNPWIGLVCFPVLVTFGTALLAGARFKRWFWLGLETGIILGLAFAYWLLFQSVYRIHALCPYCLTVDVVVITLFWYVSLYIVGRRMIELPAGFWQKVAAYCRQHHLDILVLWFLILVGVILKHFWYYYGHHLHL